MSYPKKVAANTKKNAPAQANPKLSEDRREKLLAIQEREQLKGLLVNKFIEKYGKNKKSDQDFVNKQVTEFMKNEKLTEENLKKLEQKIKGGVDEKAPLSQKGENSVVNQGQNPSGVVNARSEHSHQVGQGQNNYHDHACDDAMSIASSHKPRSVYAQGDSDDEWATMMKYDTELYKKEKELEKAREQEQKKKIKSELDRQIQDKKKVKEVEENELKRYTDLVQYQMKTYDTREQKKENDMKSKVMQEKYSRDRQLQEEHMRKKMDKKTEKEMDEILVNKIRHELDEEARVAVTRKHEDKESLKKVLIENEEHKKKLAEDARREKDADTRAQQEYTRLIEKQEADRAAELKAREDRAKKFMGMMADTVVKDQREQILDEEKKLLKHYLDKESKDMDEDQRRQQRLNDQKKEMRKYLDKQMEEKERKKQEEAALEKKQADIWKKDTVDFNEHEKNKNEYIRDVNKKHADILKKQMEDENKKHKKMNTQELLMNKPTLKEIANKNDDIKFQKQVVNAQK